MRVRVGVGAGAAVGLLLGALSCVGDSPSNPAGPDAGPDGSADAGTDADSGGNDAADAALTCDPTKPFNAPTPLTGFDTATSEGAPHLSPDELTIYFEGLNGSLSDAGTSEDLFTASRTKTTDPFGPPKKLAVSTKDAEFDPFVSTDGLTLFYSTNTSGTYQLWFATRGSTLADFSNPAALAAVAAAQKNDSQPFVTADGVELWFASDRSGGGVQHIYVAGKSGSTFVNPVLQTTLTSSADDWGPTLSADRLTIYLASNRTGTSGGFDIWTSHRASASDTFPAPAVVPEINSIKNDYPGWLSPDNCRLYLSSTRSGTSGIYMAMRAP